MKVKPIWISNSKGETGIQGIQGNTGLNGVTGLNGAPGVIGLDGVTGVIGATGFQGVTGIGVTGSKGETGAQGTVGQIGFTGFQGVTGFLGEQGETGLGIIGITGEQGVQGVTGIGVTGSKGETGAQGTVGQIGFTGFQGVTGFLGEQGETGLGIIGITGEQGVQGVTGIAPEPSECAYIYYQGKYITSLSANQTMFGSDMPTIDENEFVSSVSGEIYLDYVNGGFKVPSDIRFINVSLNFAFGFTTGDSGVYKDFRYNLVSGDEGFGATGTDTKIIASGSIQPPDTVDSYTSCSAITVDTDTFGKYINVIWLGDTIDPEEIQFSISLNSIAGIQGETGTSDHLILRSGDDALPGYFGDKVVGSDWIQRSDITESDIKKVQFALKNPDFFIKGNTNFGGSIAATLNAFTRTEFFTCYYNATGAPPAQTGNPSWFGIHINSNAIANTGINICWAYVASSLICFERVDLAGVIGTWTLRSSGSSEVSHISSMDGGGASDNIALQAGSSTQWSAHGVMTAPFGQITPVAEQSTLGFIAAQVATGSFISAIYKVEDTGVHSLICESAVTAFPASAAWVNALVLSVETGLYIPANERVYMVIMTNANGVSLAGKSASNLNLQPYVAGIKTNMGVLTAAPKTIQWESETNTRPFIYMTK